MNTIKYIDGSIKWTKPEVFKIRGDVLQEI